jgi:hypothetical protein
LRKPHRLNTLGRETAQNKTSPAMAGTIRGDKGSKELHGGKKRRKKSEIMLADANSLVPNAAT